MKEVNVLNFGWRSHWLAKSLIRKGCRVNFYDFTKSLNVKAAQDIDGPFLLDFSETEEEDFLKSIYPNEILFPNKEGFCLSSPMGNVAFKSPSSEFVIKDMEERFYSEVSKSESFWLSDFLKSFGKTKFLKSQDWSEEKKPYPVDSDFYFPLSAKSTYDLALNSLSDFGVSVAEIDTKDARHFLKELRSSSKRWIFSLSISELKSISNAPVEALKDNLAWHRKRFYFKGKELDSLPLWSMWVFSVYKAWRSSNFYILICGSDCVDVWSIEKVNNDQEVEKSRKEAEGFLKEKFPYVKFEADLGESFSTRIKSFFPVSSQVTELNDKVHLWNSPSEWESYSSKSILAHQKKILKEVASARKKRF